MILTVVLILVLAAIGVPLLHRDIRRGQARAALKARRAANARSGANEVHVSLVLQDNFTPSVKRAARAAKQLGAALEEMGEALEAEAADGEPS